jgi:hypothetical protein
MRKLFLRLFVFVTAKRVREVTYSIIKKKKEFDIFRLLKCIKNAAQEGKFSITTVRLSDEDKQILTGKGFIITVRGDSYSRISWVVNEA